jgi:hypothetical protein
VPLNQSSSLRKPNFDAPGGTQSVSISLTSVNGTKQSSSTPTVANLSASTSGCTTSSSALTCTVTVSAVPGNDLYTVTSYPQPNAQGTAIATGTASVTAVEGQTTTAPVALTGTIASITLALGTPPIAGVANTIPLVVIAKDSSGATIMGTYNTPITLTNSDTSGVTKLSAASVADSTAAAAVTIAYTGGSLASAPSIGAAAGSVSATAVPFSLNNDYSAQNGATLTYNISLTSTETRANATPDPSYTASATLTATYSTGATFNNQPNLINVHQTVTAADGMFGIGVNGGEDYYYAWTPTKTGANLYEVGYVDSWTDAFNNPQKYQEIPDAPGWQIAVVPFANGNTWSHTAKYTGSETTSAYDNSGNVIGTNTDTYTQNADGSYTGSNSEKMNDGSQNYSDTYTVNSDGSAIETTTGNDTSQQWTDVYTIGTPEPAPTGTPGLAIKYTDTYTQASPAPEATSTPDVWYGADWYPNGKVPSPLQTDVTNDLGSQTLPAECNIPSTTATTGEHIQEKYSNVDPWGYIYTTTYDYYYTPGVGLVCGTQDEFSDSYDQTTGALDFHWEWKGVQSLASTSLQDALRRTRSMTSATAFASAGLQASLSHMHRERIAAQRALRIQHRTESIRRMHHLR